MKKYVFIVIGLLLFVSCDFFPKKKMPNKLENGSVIFKNRNNNGTSTKGNAQQASHKVNRDNNRNSNRGTTNNGNASSGSYTTPNNSNVENIGAPRKWRQNNPGGGYADYVQYADGSLVITQVQPCTSCNGTTLCPACGGAGQTYGRAYGGMYYPCNMCVSSGKCKNCQGQGYVTTTSVTDAAGNTYITSSNGYSTVGGPGGAIVTSPNGRITAHPSGGTNRGSSSGRTNRDNSNDYIETIEWAPNYTGEPNYEWCEKCNDLLPAHSHIRKRVY